jgi:hypothetical protein
MSLECSRSAPKTRAQTHKLERDKAQKTRIENITKLSERGGRRRRRKYHIKISIYQRARSRGSKDSNENTTLTKPIIFYQSSRRQKFNAENKLPKSM